MLDNTELLKLVAEQSLKSSYVEAFQIQDTEHLDEALGLSLAHYVEWDGNRMKTIILAMLEDANFHRLYQVIADWFEENT